MKRVCLKKIRWTERHKIWKKTSDTDLRPSHRDAQWTWRQTGDSYKLQRKIHHSPMEGKRQLDRRDFGKRLSLDSSLVVSLELTWGREEHSLQ